MVKWVGDECMVQRFKLKFVRESKNETTLQGIPIKSDCGYSLNTNCILPICSHQDFLLSYLNRVDLNSLCKQVCKHQYGIIMSTVKACPPNRKTLWTILWKPSGSASVI